MEIDMSIKNFLEERRQVKILKNTLPQIFDKIQAEHKILLSKDSILAKLKQGKLFGIADVIDLKEHQMSYKFTCGIRKK